MPMTTTAVRNTLQNSLKDIPATQRAREIAVGKLSREGLGPAFTLRRISAVDHSSIQPVDVGAGA